MAIPGNLGSVALNEVGEAVAFGAGFALGRILEPAAVDLAQAAWTTAPIRAIDAKEAAAVAAESVDAYERMQQEASYSGYDAARFKDLYGVTLSAPGLGEILVMLRRRFIDDAQATHGFRKAKFEPEWDVPLLALKDQLLTPDQLANARQQGFVDQARQVGESALQGIDAERAEIMFDITGLPPGAAEAMQAVNRGLADQQLFAQMIREGHTKTKYTDLLYEMRRRLLTPHEYAELALRGYLTTAERDAGAQLSGMEPADTALLFEMLGRSLAVHQVTTGIARGGKYGGNYEGVPEPYLSALRESNVKPPWGNIAYANRYTYPSAFVLRSMAQTHELTFEETHQTLLDIGWKPDFAEKVATIWTGGTKAKGDTHVTKAETQVWNALHKSYVDNLSTDAETTTDLAELGVAAGSIPEVVKLWQTERAIVRRSLTPAQIKKAIGEPGKDAAWAKERLVQLGYSPEDADAFLAE